MSTADLAELWSLVRENEREIAVLKTKMDANSEALKRLEQTTDTINAILQRAVGAKTAIGAIGAIVCAAIGWLVAFLTGNNP